MRCKTVIYGGWQPKQTLDLVLSIVENKILFLSGTELWTDGQINRQGRTDAAITRCPPADLSGRDHKTPRMHCNNHYNQ